jgi:GAF domain-containing protein
VSGAVPHDLAERLDVLYEVSRRLATFSNLDALLEYATRRARELFDAEGCALLVVDHARREFRFPVASQSAGSRASVARLHEVRFPIDHGVAGWVLANDQALAIPDVQRDARFYPGVDAATGATTRAMLCAPLRTSTGPIGVIEVVNPGGDAGATDLGFLETVASDIAVAYEKAALYERLEGEVTELRRFGRLAGYGLATVGLGLVLASVFHRLVLALPLAETLAVPIAGAGALIVVAGGVLARAVGAARRR